MKLQSTALLSKARSTVLLAPAAFATASSAEVQRREKRVLGGESANMSALLIREVTV